MHNVFSMQNEEKRISFTSATRNSQYISICKPENGIYNKDLLNWNFINCNTTNHGLIKNHGLE